MQESIDDIPRIVDYNNDGSEFEFEHNNLETILIDDSVVESL